MVHECRRDANLNIDVLKYYKKHGKITLEKIVTLAKIHREANDDLEPSKQWLNENIINNIDFKDMVRMDHIKKQKRVQKKVINVSRQLLDDENYKTKTIKKKVSRDLFTDQSQKKII